MNEELRRIDVETVHEPLPERTDHDPTVVGVLLAAGGSSRFGERNKLLAEIDGKPLVRRAARTLLDSRVSRVVAVLGHQSSAVQEVLADFDVAFVANDAYEHGLSTSVERGARAAADGDADAAIFLPGDMPFVESATVDLLVDCFAGGVADAAAAAYEGQRGNPVLFGADHFDALCAVDGDVGGKDVLLDDGVLLDTDDAGVVMDIDTQDDLERVR
ncbi:molybdopterin-guanine dinucleotide biosynthesis protein A [Halococcus morrhuae DSM 1307]|uniref:Molybdopterin-guanine dinucleotide biosynthesis protein A n=1 Tax=Halococcus morrhuae DSM 1307 TaxID=931277 RepID=M0MQD2_HALMO|nr:nucleotidyltransferase family protein [Halococcus morrhuae]EMA47523.1 molybdopterin-guanine dinucleotide biosynthesis protein A [Halococcus morrhuae DSM 1307]